MFKDNSKESVAALFSSRGRKHEVIAGFFPASCAGKSIGPVSFVHLDADVYKATIESLNYVEHEHILMDKALIVLDDYDREAQGVNQAVAEFTSVHPHWKAFPLFPGQVSVAFGRLVCLRSAFPSRLNCSALPRTDQWSSNVDGVEDFAEDSGRATLFLER